MYHDFAEYVFVPRPDDQGGEVYVLLFDNGTSKKEFYVGQTRRFMGRMDDYYWADFQATTDFKVGEAIRYFCKLPGAKVVVRHKWVPNPREEERRLIDSLTAEGATLLNHSGLGYDYKDASKQSDILNMIRKRCDEIVSETRNSFIK